MIPPTGMYVLQATSIVKQISSPGILGIAYSNEGALCWVHSFSYLHCRSSPCNAAHRLIHTCRSHVQESRAFPVADILKVPPSTIERLRTAERSYAKPLNPRERRVLHEYDVLVARGRQKARRMELDIARAREMRDRCYPHGILGVDSTYNTTSTVPAFAELAGKRAHRDARSASCRVHRLRQHLVHSHGALHSTADENAC